MSAATILFTDIVGFSRKPTAEQLRLVEALKALVAGELGSLLNAPAVTRSVVALPTGDGVALAFLHLPERLWNLEKILRLILGIQAWAGEEKGVSLRLGVHVGAVELVTDINGNSNVCGDTINYAQRVMDAANPKQVLFSDAAFREYIGTESRVLRTPPFSEQRKAEFIGPFEVLAKHNLALSVYKMNLKPKERWWSNQDPLSKPSGKSQPGKSQPQPASDSIPAIDTGGGAVILGNVTVGKGSMVVGRDYIENHGNAAAAVRLAKALQGSIKEMQAGRRAWLSLENVRIVHPTRFAEDRMNFKVEAKVTNTGLTPATSVVVKCVSYFDQGEKFIDAEDGLKTTLRSQPISFGVTLFPDDELIQTLQWTEQSERFGGCIRTAPSGERKVAFYLFIGVGYRIVGDDGPHITTQTYRELNAPMGIEISPDAPVSLFPISTRAGYVD